MPKILNIVIGKPLIDPSELIAYDKKDWEENEKLVTMFTNERFLPAILKEAGIVTSTSEVRRNRPDLVKNLTDIDCTWIKWGKNKVYIIIGQ